MIAPLLVALGGRRVDGETFASSLKDSWNKWELQGTVCLSLFIQIFLILTGNCRKHSHRPFLTISMWFAYLTADPVAIYAVGIITTKLTRSTNPKIDHNVHLAVFWSPFLLLHLGGPDTITAYSLEDNELWLRHLLSLLIQTCVTFYTILMVWTGSNLSILTIPMIFAGLLKYGERVWVLRAGSTEHFRDSIPHPVSNYTKLTEEQKLREAEGFIVVPYEVNEARQAVSEHNLEGLDYSMDEKSLNEETKYKRSQGELLAARGLVNIFQRLFADLLLSFQDRDMSLVLLKGKNFQAAFRIVEIELGLMFDMFYTKAKAIHTRWGIARRVVVILFSAVILVLFSSLEAHSDSYSLIDVALTSVLLGVAIFLEVYALIFLVFSDKAACWLIKSKKFKTLEVIHWLQPLWKRRRWSGKVAQFSLLSFSLREKHLFCDQLLKLLRMDEDIEKHMYKSDEEVSDEVKQLIIESFKGRKESWNTRGSHVLDKFKQTEKLRWSIEMEFDQSIIIWHIATELFLNPSNPFALEPAPLEAENGENVKSRQKISSLLSRYMMYLLVFHPLMLPLGIGRLKFKDTYIEAMKFFDKRKSARDKAMACFDERKSVRDKLMAILNEPNSARGKASNASEGKSQNMCLNLIVSLLMWNSIKGGDGESKLVKVGCKQLRDEVNTKLNMIIGKEDKSKFVLFHGCQLASQLEKMEDIRVRSEMLSEVWVEMLAYAASKCKGSYHCQQLRRGGELLTHVWLLLAHFGLTDHFQSSGSSSIAELIVT